VNRLKSSTIRCYGRRASSRQGGRLVADQQELPQEALRLLIEATQVVDDADTLVEVRPEIEPVLTGPGYSAGPVRRSTALPG